MQRFTWGTLVNQVCYILLIYVLYKCITHENTTKPLAKIKLNLDYLFCTFLRNDKKYNFCLYFYFRKKTGDWPSYCYFIAWILTLLFILGGMGMVAMYGLQFGNEKTYGWFTAITINFFWNVFVESPIKVREI